MKQYILAVDFDGTIVKTEDDYVPRSLMPNVKTVLDWARDKGCYIIIWTCRSGKMLKQAIDFLDKQKIPYDAVNKNHPKVDFETSRKIFASYYIDDRSFDIDWLKIKQKIQKELVANLAKEIKKTEKDNV